MNQHQLWFIMEKSFSGCTFKEILFSENEDMSVAFWDSGSNFHKQILHEDGTFSTVEI